MWKQKFAGMQIQAARRTHILDCYQEMTEDGIGNGSITLIHKVLSAMLNHAVAGGLYPIGANLSKQTW